MSQDTRAMTRSEQKKQWREQGLYLPYGYTKPVELGGECIECYRRDGRHDRFCLAVD